MSKMGINFSNCKNFVKIKKWGGLCLTSPFPHLSSPFIMPTSFLFSSFILYVLGLTFVHFMDTQKTPGLSARGVIAKLLRFDFLSGDSHAF